MKLTFLGTGSAFTYGDNNYQSNMLITSSNNKKLLIDCGTDIRFSTGDIGLRAEDLDAVYISHAHADHVGGLEWLGFCTYFNPSVPKPSMFVNEELADIVWHNCLKGGMGTLQGRLAVLDDYFDVVRIPRNGYFVWENVHFQLIRVIHYMHGFDIAPSFGLIITVNKIKYFVTTDTQFTPHQLIDFYYNCDVIFQDCETSNYKTGVHAHFSELSTLPVEIKRKMWLYHYQSGRLPDAEAEGFAGFVKKGQQFDLLHPETIVPILQTYFAQSIR